MPEMEETGSDDDFLKLRVQQLERERDDLRKDIENLYLQQAGPSYLSAATQMHSQRTTGLEEENESLRKMLALSVRDNKNLQEQLSEAYRIKAQLADLHAAEVSKNIEAEKQIKFFQSCVASAFSERDSSLIEAEKAKEQWETLSGKLGEYKTRLCEVESRYDDEKKLNSILQVEMEKLKDQGKIFAEVTYKFSEIRESAFGCSDPSALEAKCSTLLNDPSEMWIFDINGNHGRYIASLEEQVTTLRESIDGLQRKMRMGMDIEQYLRGRVRSLEKKQVRSEDKFRHDLSTLREFVNHQRFAIMAILEEESINIRSTLDQLQEKVKLVSKENYLHSRVLPEEGKCDNSGEEIVDIASNNNITVKGNPTGPVTKGDMARAEKEEDPADRECNSSDVLAQATKEKVEALLLLSQEEERHLLERDLNTALEKRIADLQRSLLQVTNEKVQALLDLAQLKQEYQLLLLNRGTIVQDKSERLKNLLRRTYLGRWVGKDESAEESQPSTQKTHLSLDSARLKAENEALRESMVNVDLLASSICKLRFSLLKVIEEARSAAPAESLSVSLEGICREADCIRDNLRGTLPVSWSGGTDDTSRTEDVDIAATVGSEMVELLVLSAELVRDYVFPKVSMSLSCG